MGAHSTASLLARHPIHNWEYADAAARIAATGFLAADQYKVALQLSDFTYWILSNYAGPTWQQTSSSGSVTATAGSLLANAVVLGAGGTDTKVVAGITSDGISRLYLGVAGASIGRLDFHNTISGAISLSPTSGALGTSALIIPALSGTLAVLQASAGIFLHIDGGASQSRLILDADNNVAKLMSWRTDNSPRWALRVDGNETGSNVGGDLSIRRYNDAGTFIDAPLLFVRSTGNATFAAKVTTVASATGGAGLNLPHGTAPTAPTNGDLWTTTAGLYARINGGTVGPYGIGDALVANPLSQFAATTSAQLRGVISDETGTGVLMFNGNPKVNNTLGSTGVLYLDADSGQIQSTKAHSFTGTNWANTGAGSAISTTAGSFLQQGTNTASSGNPAAFMVNPTWNQTGTAGSYDFLINRTNTALGSGSHYLIDAMVASVSKFAVTTAGNLTLAGSITTGAPVTGTAGAWKLGIRVAAAVVFDATQYIQLDVAGTLYKVAIAT